MIERARTQYQNVPRKVRKKLRKSKEEWIEEQCSTIVKNMESGDNKKTYNTHESISKASQPRAAVIDYKDGKQLTEREGVLKRWNEYCDCV